MIETWTEWAKIYPAVVADALRAPRKPVVLGEGAYEDGPEYPQGPITPLLVRRQAWWTVMAGGFHTYGQNQMWRMDAGWDKTFDTPGAAQVCLMRRILAGLPWWDLLPDQGVFASGVGSERTLNTAMRSKDGTRILIYLSRPTTVFLPPREDRGEDREGHVDQPGHRREEGRGRLCDRQLQRPGFPRLPHAVLQDPGLLGGRGAAARRRREVVRPFAAGGNAAGVKAVRRAGAHRSPYRHSNAA